MRTKVSLLVWAATLCCVLSTLAQTAPEEDTNASAEAEISSTQTDLAVPTKTTPQSLFSPSVARRFYEMAYEIANAEDVSPEQAEQAIVLLKAALALDQGAGYVHPLLIKTAAQYSQKDYSELVSGLLKDYVNSSADLEVVRAAVTYLLDQLDSREKREKYLVELFTDLSGKSPVLDSELTTLLGLLMIEKADNESAKFYLVQAYNSNKYNKLAFRKLIELLPNQIGPAMYTEHLRFVLRENPIDIEVALNFALYAERLQLYEIAADAYEYCANLFTYLYPDELLPPRIYLPWAVATYNTQRRQHRCMQIAKLVRQDGRFDLLLEALAGKAAAKIGNDQEAERIFEAAEAKIQQLLEQGPDSAGDAASDAGAPQPVGAKQVAWFYCFACPDPEKAMKWANKAYSIEPNTPTTCGILAYAFTMNDENKWAKPLIEAAKDNQIALLANARVQLAEGQKTPALDSLSAAVNKDPASLAAEEARRLLDENGAKYIPPIDPDVVRVVLKESVGEPLAPKFIRPERTITVQFNIRGNKFSYGSSFDGNVAIMNNSAEPLVISDDGLFRGNIRIDAEVTGDLSKKFANLASLKVRNTALINPGRSMLVSLPLVTGELRDLMRTHPQASLNIEFTLYIDPVTTDEGQVSNRLVNIKPVKLTVARPGLELTGRYLRNRFNSISTGQAGQKIKTAQLFIGLLKEQYAMSSRKPLYRFRYADWMPPLLKNALLHESGLLRNPGDGQWVVKVHTMADMLSLPLDHELVSAVAENLGNTNWPVRLMAVYLLNRTPDDKFARVLDWAAKFDSDELVRNMAVALGAAPSGQGMPILSEPALTAPDAGTEPVE